MAVGRVAATVAGLLAAAAFSAPPVSAAPNLTPEAGVRKNVTWLSFTISGTTRLQLVLQAGQPIAGTDTRPSNVRKRPLELNGLASAVGGIREVVADGCSGVLVSYDAVPIEEFGSPMRSTGCAPYDRALRGPHALSHPAVTAGY